MRGLLGLLGAAILVAGQTPNSTNTTPTPIPTPSPTPIVTPTPPTSPPPTTTQPPPPPTTTPPPPTTTPPPPTTTPPPPTTTLKPTTLAPTTTAPTTQAPTTTIEPTPEPTTTTPAPTVTTTVAPETPAPTTSLRVETTESPSTEAPFVTDPPTKSPETTIIPSATPEETAASGAASPKKSSSSTVIIASICGCVAAIAIVGGVILLRRSNDRDESEDDGTYDLSPQKMRAKISTTLDEPVEMPIPHEQGTSAFFTWHSPALPKEEKIVPTLVATSEEEVDVDVGRTPSDEMVIQPAEADIFRTDSTGQDIFLTNTSAQSYTSFIQDTSFASTNASTVPFMESTRGSADGRDSRLSVENSERNSQVSVDNSDRDSQISVGMYRESRLSSEYDRDSSLSTSLTPADFAQMQHLLPTNDDNDAYENDLGYDDDDEEDDQFNQSLVSNTSYASDSSQFFLGYGESQQSPSTSSTPIVVFATDRGNNYAL
ncbi:unnamed protein product [Aphanomyces euteiches]|uniref:Uncharacterized protein n=2 Tax=Aphanomyces euteiches TaxID=100861 RepID=A0A6G0WI88_9STRA|nr:hypothetical protein Ae201684_014905 [Aphanomyces euteiches]KAH9076585.1 hypothetical protein Ae201684P_010525 [Aphanomyces euteiches]